MLPKPNLEKRARALRLRLEGRTFAEISKAVGVSRQRCQQLLRPPRELRVRLVTRGACDDCGTAVGKSGHVHHRATEGMTAETYNAEANLTLLCAPCHSRAHADPIPWRIRRLRTPEELADVYLRRGYEIGAAKLGITVEDYQTHREAGERWCSWHKAWEAADLFGLVKSKTSGICRDGNREMVRQKQGAEYKRDYYWRNRERLNAYQREWQRQRRQRAAS